MSPVPSFAPITETIETAAVLDPKASERKVDFQHVAHLADSLTDISQLHPIVVKRQTSTTQVILHDGAHRLHAARQKGLSTIRALVFPETTPDDHIRRCILERDFLTREDSWAVRCLKLQELKLLYEACYPETKVGRGKRGKARDKSAIPAFVAHIARESRDKTSTIAEMLTLAKDLGPTLLGKLDEHQLSKQVGKDLRSEPEAQRMQVVEKLVAMKKTIKPGRRSDLTVAAALHEIKRDARKAACESAVLTSSDAEVIHSMMEDCNDRIKDHSIDAVITDPLYHHEHLELYGKASELSARVLKPGGFAAFYCGRLYVDTVMGHLSKHLRFRGFTTIRHKEHFGNAGSTKIAGDCKYILVYQNSGADVDFYTSLKGVIEGVGQVKENHEYEQNVSDLDNLIDAITQPGEVILDMFAGSGTTGVAAIQKARKIKLIEKEEVHCNTCRARLNEALALRVSRIPIPSLIKSTDSTAAHPEDVSDDEPEDLRTAM